MFWLIELTFSGTIALVFAHLPMGPFSLVCSSSVRQTGAMITMLLCSQEPRLTLHD